MLAVSIKYATVTDGHVDTVLRIYRVCASRGKSRAADVSEVEIASAYQLSAVHLALISQCDVAIWCMLE